MRLPGGRLGWRPLSFGATAHCGSQILPQALEDRMAHLALGGLCPVLDLGEQFGLDPDAAMGDSFAVGLGRRIRLAFPLVRTETAR